MDDIHAKAELGRYRITRLLSSFQKVTHFDDLTFLSTGLTRFPLEGYKERCETRGPSSEGCHAENPLILETPIYISGMSYGALSANAKVALGKAAAMVGSASCYRRRRDAAVGERRGSETDLSTRCCPAATGSTPTIWRRPRPSKSSWAKEPSPAPAGCSWASRCRTTMAEMRDLPLGHRPAQSGPPSRLARPRRPGRQDRAAPRGHRLARSESTSSWAPAAWTTT